MKQAGAAGNEDAPEHSARDTQTHRTLAFRVVGATVVFACGDTPLDAKEWDVYLGVLAETFRAKHGVRSLVYAHSAQPTAVQRGKLSAVLKQAAEAGATLKSAVMTPSPLVRGVITALQWFHRDAFRTFAPRDLDKALSFLELNAEARSEVKRVLQDLQRRLGLSPLR